MSCCVVSGHNCYGLSYLVEVSKSRHKGHSNVVNWTWRFWNAASRTENAESHQKKESYIFGTAKYSLHPLPNEQWNCSHQSGFAMVSERDTESFQDKRLGKSSIFNYTSDHFKENLINRTRQQIESQWLFFLPNCVDIRPPWEHLFRLIESDTNCGINKKLKGYNSLQNLWKEFIVSHKAIREKMKKADSFESVLHKFLQIFHPLH